MSKRLPTYRPGAIAGVLLALIVAGTSYGCDSPSNMFTGRWEHETREAVSPLGGWPAVAIGHYGHEVAGVTYLHEQGSLISYLPACPCVWIDHYRVDLAEAEVQFTTRCEAGGDALGQTLHWRLEFQVDDETGDELLVGTVAPEYEETPVEPNLRLIRTGDQLTEADKQCPPEDLVNP